MDNTIDNLSIINEDKFYSNEEKSIKVIKKQNNIDINQKEQINDVFDFDKSLELSNIIEKDDKIINQKKENESDENINLSLDYSFINNIEISKNAKENDNKIRTVKTVPIKKLKKEDLDKIPLPIFSCIYCSNDYISFKHLSNEILSNKYLFQTSNFDLKQINDLLFPSKYDRNNINNKLLNIIINNSEYLRFYYNINKIKEYFNLDNFKKECLNNEIILKKAFKQRFEDNIIRKKKDFYFKGIKSINKIPKSSLNNKGLFNSNSLINNYSGLTGFIGNNQIVPQPQVEKLNNNATHSNSSLSYFNSVSINNNKNEIGLIGKGKNRHYMENIMENTNKNIETENTIEEKVEILDIFGENDLKRKINRNDIEWENIFYDINNPVIEEIDSENIVDNEVFDIKKNKNNQTLFNTIDNTRNIHNKHCYINSENNVNYNNNKLGLLNRKLALFNNNSKSQVSTNTSSNIILKNSVRDKENKSLSSFINGNKILNIQNNNSTLNPTYCNINIKNKLADISFKNKNEKKLNYCNRTPSFTKTRIIDLNTNSEKKINNHAKSSINLKNINKKILFNYTANIKKDLIDKNNISSKIKNVFQNNKNNNTLGNNNLYLNKKLFQININNNGIEVNKKYNKYNLLLTKQNNENTYNKTLFNKTANGLKLDKEKKKSYNFNFLLKIKNNFEYCPFKQQIDCSKQSSIFEKKNITSLRNYDNENNDHIYNNIKIKDFNFNLRSLDKGNKKRKNNNICKINKSARKAKISIPQKLFQENNETRIDEKAKSLVKIGILNLA